MKDIRFIVAVVASLGLVLGGCSEDESKKNGDEENQVVNAGEGDVGSGDVEDVGEGAEGDAEDEDVGDVEEDADEEELEFPDVEPVECAYPDESPECAQGEYGPASFMNKLRVAEGRSCCVDFTGDGRNDNLLGRAMGAMSIFGNDINEGIELEIEHGGLIYLLETANWVHPQWDAEIDLYIHEATAIRGSSMAPVLDGEGGVYLAPWSMVEGTDVRRYGFERAYVHDGTLYATGGSFQVRFPGLLSAINARMERMSIEAKVVQDPSPELGAQGGFYLEDGKIGGAVVRDELFESLNQAARDCECMEENFELFTFNEDHDRWDCGLKGTEAMDCAGSTVECRAFAEPSVCEGLQTISASPDVMVGEQKAFSAGLTFESVPVEILGVHDW